MSHQSDAPVAMGGGFGHHAQQKSQPTQPNPTPTNPAQQSPSHPGGATSADAHPPGTPHHAPAHGTSRRVVITDYRDQAQLPSIRFTDSRLVTTEPEDACRVVLTSRPADPHGLWAPSRAAAFVAAAKCKLPMASCSTRNKQPGLILTRPDVTVVDGLASLLTSKDGMHGSQAKGKHFEQEGGPSLEDLIAFVDAYSSAPLIDIQLLVRWILVSYLFGHAEAHAGQVVLLNRSGSWRLAPFAWMTLFPAVAGGPQYPLARGFKIGGEWPGEHLRVDHWVRLAKAAKIHPKVIISMGREIAEVAPKAVLEAICKAMQTTQLRGPSADVVRAVQRRCARFKELAMLAPRQGVAGIKAPPVVAPPDHNEPERKTIETFYE